MAVTLETSDRRFYFREPSSWRARTQKSGVHCEEYVLRPKTTEINNQIEFEFPNDGPVAFGPMTGFVVRGVFERRTRATEAAVAGEWDLAPAADSANILLQPNWFEHLVKSVEVYHDNQKVSVHNTPKFADPYLHEYLFAYMDPLLKDCLFTEAQNPGHTCHANKVNWMTGAAATDASQFADYAKHVLGVTPVEFLFVPPFVFPFYQSPNFSAAEHLNVLPMHQLGRMTVTLSFRDSFENVIAATTAEGKKHDYRFRLLNCDLQCQYARCSDQLHAALRRERRTLYFGGLTKRALAESPPAGTLSHRFSFADVPMPEGVFIFALPKGATTGIKKFQPEDLGYKQHGIHGVEVTVNDKRFYMKTPNPTNLKTHTMDRVHYFDHRVYPPFGVYQDTDLVSFERTLDGCKDTLHPHVYLSLVAVPGAGGIRKVPVGETGSVYKANVNLDIAVKFGTDGSPADVTYLCYIFYTDVNMRLDLGSRVFRSVYTPIAN